MRSGNPEAGFPKHDKRLSVPLAAKKTALRDLQNENRKVVPKSNGSSLLKDNGPVVEAVKVSGIKRPQQECIMRSSNNACLVYVRRKTESEQHKSSNCNKTNDQSMTLYEDEKNHEQSPMKDSTICIRKDVPEPKTSSEGVPSTTPLVAFDSEKPNITMPLAHSNYLQLENTKKLSIQHLEERYIRLQNFLKALDQSSQDDYRQMLRSLNSVDLSRIAVELEKRSIQLCLEEGASQFVAFFVGRREYKLILLLKV